MTTSNRLLPHKFADIFPLISTEEMKELTTDVKEHGLQDPITLYEGFILDGRNRYRAAFNAGLWPDSAQPPVKDRSIFDVFKGTDEEALAFVISKNLKRRHLDESQRSMVAARLEQIQHGGDRKSDQDANLHLDREKAAKTLNVSKRSVAAAKKVQTEGTAELNKAVDQGEIAVSTAADVADLPKDQQKDVVRTARAKGKKKGDGAVSRAARTEVKKRKRDKKEKALGTKQRALPKAKFGVILADPAWRFEPRSRVTGLDRAADNHYPTQELRKILKLKVGAIAAKDSVLFLWATAPLIKEALVVMATWGFIYKTHLIWHKLGNVAPGYWFRGRHELLLIGTRGSVPAPAPGTQAESVLRAAKGKHSEKPEAVLRLIEKYYPTLPKIELNRRGPARPGWEAWGNEATTTPAPLQVRSAGVRGARAVAKSQLGRSMRNAENNRKTAKTNRRPRIK